MNKSAPDVQGEEISRNVKLRLPLSIAMLVLVAGMSFAVGWHLRGPVQISESQASSVPKAKVATPARAANPLVWDKKSALGEILAKSAGGARLAAIAKLVDETPLADLGALIDEARNCPSASSRQFVYELAYAKWVAADPNGALAHAYAAAVRAGNPGQLPVVFAAWGGIDPAAALAAAVKLDRASFRQQAIKQVVTSWVQTGDPLQAVAAVASLPRGIGDPDLLQTVFQNWSEQDPVAAWANLDKIGPGKQRVLVQGVILNDLAASDPAQALQLLRSLPVNQQLLASLSMSGNPSQKLYADLFLAWARQDPAAALAAARALPPGASRTQSIESAFAGWAEADPLAALKATAGFPAAEQAKLLQKGLDGLARQNPLAAADYIAAMPPSPSRADYITALAEKWADHDPAAALAWLDKNALGSAYDVATGKVLAQFSKTDPQAAIAYILQLPDGTKRESYLQDAVAAWGGQDPAAAMAWIDGNLSSSMRDTAMMVVMRPFVQSDPVAAEAYVGQLPVGGVRDQLLSAEGVALAALDTKAALDWIHHAPEFANPNGQGNVLSRILDTLATVDPAGAAEYYLNYANDVSFAYYQDRLLTAWAKNDASGVMNWAQSLPAGSSRDAALSAALGSQAVSDPISAMNYAQSLPEGDGRITAIGRVIQGWSQTDPVAAVGALSNLPPGPVLNEATRSSMGGWINQDPQAASQWIKTMPEGDSKKLSTILLAENQMTSDPATAYAWAMTVPEPENRTSLFSQIFVAWVKKDPAAAGAALEATPLSDASRAMIQRRMQQAAARPFQTNPGTVISN